MCNPVAFTAGATALRLIQEGGNARAMAQYGRQAFEANKKVAEDDAIRSYAALQARQSQDAAKASQAINAAALESQRRASLARVSAGESGAAGNTAMELNDEFKRAELGYQTTVIRNKAMLDAQFGNELEGVRIQEQGRILAGQPGP